MINVHFDNDPCKKMFSGIGIVMAHFKSLTSTIQYIGLVCYPLRNLTGAIWCLFDPCVNLMGWRPF